MGQFDDAKDRIVQGAEWMTTVATALECRSQRAADAGAELAAEVYRFLADPEVVGKQALDAAYRRFMALHSGNFSGPSPAGAR